MKIIQWFSEHGSAIFRWLWLPLVLTFVAVLLSIPRHRLHKFFDSIGFRGYDGKLPRHTKTSTVTPYLKKLRFRTTVPFIEWDKAKPTLEMFFKKRIYTIEQNRKDVRMIEIQLIQEELPNFLLWEDKFMLDGSKFAIGESYRGREIWDAATLPHGLIAGATGGGKTALLRCIIHQTIFKCWNVTVLDFKGGGDYIQEEREAQKYRDLEDGYGPFLISDPVKARDWLLALTIEAKSRMDTFKAAEVSNIDEYNTSGKGCFVPWLLVIDEAAEIFDVKPVTKADKELYAEINQSLRTLARLSRAAGVHILMGFIRPSADVLDGQIKNNLLWRVSGYFADPAASRIVLDNDKATELPPEIKGRFVIGQEETQAYYLPVKSQTDTGH